MEKPIENDVLLLRQQLAEKDKLFNELKMKTKSFAESMKSQLNTEKSRADTLQANLLKAETATREAIERAEVLKSKTKSFADATKEKLMEQTNKIQSLEFELQQINSQRETKEKEKQENLQQQKQEIEILDETRVKQQHQLKEMEQQLSEKEKLLCDKEKLIKEKENFVNIQKESILEKEKKIQALELELHEINIQRELKEKEEQEKFSVSRKEIEDQMNKNEDILKEKEQYLKEKELLLQEHENSLIVKQQELKVKEQQIGIEKKSEELEQQNILELTEILQNKELELKQLINLNEKQSLEYEVERSKLLEKIASNDKNYLDIKNQANNQFINERHALEEQIRDLKGKQESNEIELKAAQAFVKTLQDDLKASRDLVDEITHSYQAKLIKAQQEKSDFQDKQEQLNEELKEIQKYKQSNGQSLLWDTKKLLNLTNEKKNEEHEDSVSEVMELQKESELLKERIREMAVEIDKAKNESSQMKRIEDLMHQMEGEITNITDKYEEQGFPKEINGNAQEEWKKDLTILKKIRYEIQWYRSGNYLTEKQRERLKIGELLHELSSSLCSSSKFSFTDLSDTQEQYQILKKLLAYSREKELERRKTQNLNIDLEEQNVSVRRLEAELELIQEKYQSEVTEKTKLGNEIASLKEKIKNLEEQAADALKLQRQETFRCDEIQRTLTEAKKQAGILKTDSLRLEKELQGKLRDVTNQLNQVSKSLIECEKRNQQLVAELDSEKKSSKEKTLQLNNQKSSIDEVNKLLVQERENNQDKKRKMKAFVDSLSSQKIRLEKELSIVTKNKEELMKSNEEEQKRQQELIRELRLKLTDFSHKKDSLESESLQVSQELQEKESLIEAHKMKRLTAKAETQKLARALDDARIHANTILDLTSSKCSKQISLLKAMQNQIEETIQKVNYGRIMDDSSINLSSSNSTSDSTALVSPSKVVADVPSSLSAFSLGKIEVEISRVSDRILILMENVERLCELATVQTNRSIKDLLIKRITSTISNCFVRLRPTPTMEYIPVDGSRSSVSSI